MRASSTRTGGKITIFAAYADLFEPAGKRDHHVVSEKTGRPQDGGSRCLADTPESTAARIRIEVGAGRKDRQPEERQLEERQLEDRQLEERQAVFDEKWTQEALYNLLDNAVKYTDPGDWIEVCWTEYELFLRIDVTELRNRDPRARDRAYFRKICPRRTGEKSGGRGDRSVPCGPDRDRGGRIFESEKHPR